MNRAHRAFTLTELLVVIAIIAILAAILFPVFAQAKLAAKKSVDQSNFKQTALALIMYSNDFDDTYPMSTFWSGVSGTFGQSYTWSSSLCVQPYIKTSGLYHCPVDPNPTQQTTTFYGMNSSRVPAFQSFQSNGITPAYQMFVSTQYPLGVANPQGLMPSAMSMPPCDGYACSQNTTTTTTSVPLPTTIVLLAGGNNEFYGDFWGCGSYINNEIDWCYTGYGITEQYKITTMTLAVPTDSWYAGWRKFSNQSNYAFSDGHVKALAPGAVTDPARWVINPPAGDNYSG